MSVKENNYQIRSELLFPCALLCSNFNLFRRLEAAALLCHPVCERQEVILIQVLGVFQPLCSLFSMLMSAKAAALKISVRLKSCDGCESPSFLLTPDLPEHYLHFVFICLHSNLR